MKAYPGERNEENNNLSFFFILILVCSQSVLAESSINFKPGSWIPTEFTWEITNVIPGKSPDRLRIELFTPDGEKAWMVDGETDYKKDLGYGRWLVQVYDKNLFVPGPFPQTGAWRIKFIFYSEVWIIDNIVADPFHTFNVIEGGLLENLMAPIYIFMEGPLGWGVMPTFKLALPGLFWCLSPFWIVAALIIAIRLWKESIGRGMKKLTRGKKYVEK